MSYATDFHKVRRLLTDRVKSVGPDMVEAMGFPSFGRDSIISASLTASSFMTTSPRLGEDADEGILDTPTFSFEGNSTASDYSPSLASVRQAVVRARNTDDTTLVHLVAMPNNQTTPTLTAAEAFKAQVTAASRLHADPIRNESDLQHLGQMGGLFASPAPGQRMQSFLAPKMTIHSPAPWDDLPSEPARPATSRKISAPMWPLLDSSRDDASSVRSKTRLPETPVIQRRGPSFSAYDAGKENPSPLVKPQNSAGKVLPISPSDQSIDTKLSLTDSFQSAVPQPLQPSARANSNQPMRLISLDAARSIERDRISSNTRKAEVEPVPRQLKGKRSGFLKMLKKKDESAPAMPLPMVDANSLPLRRSEGGPPLAIVVPPNDSPIPRTLKSAPPTITSMPTSRSPTAIAFAPTPNISANDRINRKEDGLAIPKVNLRPISMAFSANFSETYLFADGQVRHDRLPSSSTSQSSMSERSPSDAESVLTSPTTPGFPSCLNSPTLSHAGSGLLSPTHGSGWQQSTAELLAQIRTLEAEVEMLKQERARSGRTCESCGATNHSQNSTSVITRGRVIAPDVSGRGALFTGTKVA